MALEHGAAREKEKAGNISDKLDAREEENMDLKLQVAALQAELQTKVQMAPIGKVNGRFPPDMIFHLWRLLANLVSARKLPEIFKSEAKYFYGEDVKAEPPGHQRLSQYRQSLGVAAFLHSAWILATCVKCTLHTDMTTKNQLKLGVAALKCVMPNGVEKSVALDGVFTQAGGTAIESKDQLLRCIDDAVQLLQSLREYAQENDSGVDISDVPAVSSVAELEGMLQVIMSDQAAAATLTAKEPGCARHPNATSVGLRRPRSHQHGRRQHPRRERLHSEVARGDA